MKADQTIKHIQFNLNLNTKHDRDLLAMINKYRGRIPIATFVRDVLRRNLKEIMERQYGKS